MNMNIFKCIFTWNQTRKLKYDFLGKRAKEEITNGGKQSEKSQKQQKLVIRKPLSVSRWVSNFNGKWSFSSKKQKAANRRSRKAERTKRTTANYSVQFLNGFWIFSNRGYKHFSYNFLLHKKYLLSHDNDGGEWENTAQRQRQPPLTS